MVGLAAGALLAPKPVPARYWMIVAATAIVPDLDAIGRPFHAGDVAWLGGHRALTHSLLFAAALGGLAVASNVADVGWRRHWPRLWLALCVAIALHGVFDTLADYGDGVMFFAPFSDTRYTSPWHPHRGLISDTLLGFLPALIVINVVRHRRRLSLPTRRRWPRYDATGNIGA
jgi:inner membrane protein